MATKNDIIDTMIDAIGDDASDEEAAEWLAKEAVAITLAVIVSPTHEEAVKLAEGIVAIRAIGIDGGTIPDIETELEWRCEP